MGTFSSRRNSSAPRISPLLHSGNLVFEQVSFFFRDGSPYKIKLELLSHFGERSCDRVAVIHVPGYNHSFGNEPSAESADLKTFRPKQKFDKSNGGVGNIKADRRHRKQPRWRKEVPKETSRH